MNILFTGFGGYKNPSKIIVENIDSDKIILKNSYNEIERQLSNIALEKYDLIIMLGLRNNLKKSIRLEKNALINDEIIESNLNLNVIKDYFINNGISCRINSKPTNYLCNFAYFNVLKRNKKCVFIHIPGLENIKDINKLIEIISNINTTTNI